MKYVFNREEAHRRAFESMLENGVPAEDYKDYYLANHKIPKRVRDLLKVDPTWFTPPLGLEGVDVIYVTNQDDAEAVAHSRYKRGLLAYLRDKLGCDDALKLKPDELEAFMDSEYYEEPYWHLDDVIDDLKETLRDILNRHKGVWRVDARNITWRGGSASDCAPDSFPRENVEPKDVLELLYCYGSEDYTLETFEDGSFSLCVKHHDQPIGGTTIVLTPK